MSSMLFPEERSSLTLSRRPSKVKPPKHHHHNQYIADIGGRRKYATRHLAALDFLQSISMKNEAKIIESGLSAFQGPSDARITVQKPEETVPDMPQQYYTEDIANIAGGRKLEGRAALTAHLPLQVRYRLLRLSEQSALVRQWEESMLRDPSLPLLSSRLFFSRARGYPTCVSSVTAYAPMAEKLKQEKQKSEDNRGVEVFKQPVRDWRGVSYAAYLKKSEDDTSSVEHNGETEPSSEVVWMKDFRHDPNALDDPDVFQGKHRYVLRPDELSGPVLSSVILFANDEELKENLNEWFREQHPNLPPSLTLSKIRNLKKTALLGCLSINIEVSTVAIGYVLFEQLCLKGVVTKYNRHLSMSCCLILAVKFNEHLVISADNKKNMKLEALFDFIDREWSIPKKEVLEAEFGAFVHLGLCVNIPYQHVFLVYTRLLKLVHKSHRNYLGEEMYQAHSQVVLAIEREIKMRKKKSAMMMNSIN